MLVMMGWGHRWLADAKPSVRLRHHCCKLDFDALVVCSHCREPIAANNSIDTTSYGGFGGSRILRGALISRSELAEG